MEVKNMTMTMMMWVKFVKHITNTVVLRCTVSQPNKCAFRCHAYVKGETVAVRRAVGKLYTYEMTKFQGFVEMIGRRIN